MRSKSYDILETDHYSRIRERKRRGRNIFIAIVILLIVIVTMLMILRVMRRNKPSPRFMFLSREKIAETQQVDALILRDESVFEAREDGIWRPEFPNGSRISKGETVGYILKDRNDDILKRLEKAENDILARLYELIQTQNHVAANQIYAEAENDMRNVISILYTRLINRDLRSLNSDETAMQVILDQRNERLKNYKFDDEQLDKLIQNYELIEDRLSQDATRVNATQAGIFIRTVDGLGNSLTTERYKDISAAEFKSYLTKSPRDRLPEIVSAEKDKPLFALTSSIEQYFVCLLPPGFANRAQVNSVINAVSSVDGINLDHCTVVRSEETEEGTLLVLRCDAFLERFVDRRVVPLELSVDEEEGLRVPRTALIDFKEGNTTAHIYVVSGGYIQKTEVGIKHHNDDFALIESLDDAPYKVEISTMIVLNPEVTEEGEAVRGISNY